jgi:aromatic-amino-acid transaminase
MVSLIFGEGAPSDRIAAAQTPGGSGAVRLLCELVARAERGAVIWLSDPTWPNHMQIARAAHLEFRTYPYFDKTSCEVDWPAMRAALSEAGPGDVVVLHGCCHNPTGANLTEAQWREIAALAVDRGFTPFIDIAYQGFGDGLEADAASVRILAESVPELLIAASCSKNFALYRDRVGCAIALAATPEAAKLAKDNMKGLARVNWSMPPDHGAAVVRTILTDPELRADWEAEVDEMRERMLSVRAKLAEALRARTTSDRYDFIAGHRGMFSLTGLSDDEIAALRDAHGVYVVSDSRINIAGLNAESAGAFAEAVAGVAAR